jgi:hypothetical protein
MQKPIDPPALVATVQRPLRPSALAKFPVAPDQTSYYQLLHLKTVHIKTCISNERRDEKLAVRRFGETPGLEADF